MSLRDYFAGQSLAGQMASCANRDNIASVADMAAWAYTLADAMVGRAGENERLRAELANVRELWQIASDNAIARQNLLEKAREQQQQANQIAGKMRLALQDIASATSPSQLFADADKQALKLINQLATAALSGANQ